MDTKRRRHQPILPETLLLPETVLLPLLLLLASASRPSLAASVPRYLWWTDEGAGPASLWVPAAGEEASEPRILAASFADDAPQSAVRLPFAFPFFGVPLRRLYASPNGFLTVAADPPCCGGTETLAVCRFEYRAVGCAVDDFEGVLAPSALDLDPGSAAAATVAERTLGGGAAAAVRWEAVPPYAQRSTPANVLASFTFTVRLEQDGAVAFGYENVTDPDEGADGDGPFEWVSRTWLAGMRPPATPAGLAPYGTPAPAEAAAWRVSSFGSYPPRDALRAGAVVRACPLSPPADVCAHPAGGPAAGGGLVRVAAPHDSCLRRAAQLGLRCVFGGAPPVDASYNATAGALECVAPPGADGTEVPIRLRFDGAARGEDAETGAVYRYGSAAPPPAGACERCGGRWPALCAADCAGVPGGSAARDACGVCAGGTTGLEPGADLDCAGVCFGAALEAEGGGGCACPPGSDPRCPADPARQRSPVPGETDAGGDSADPVQVYQALVAALVFALLAWLAAAAAWARWGDRVRRWAGERRDAKARARAETGAGMFMGGFDAEDDGGDDGGRDGTAAAAPLRAGGAGAASSSARELVRGDDPGLDRLVRMHVGHLRRVRTAADPGAGAVGAAPGARGETEEKGAVFEV